LGERIAASFLEAKGYQRLTSNYRFAGREIDLLFANGPCLVAVEVKMRRGNRYGRAVEAVDRRKLERIRFALRGALASERTRREARIDLVVIDFSRDMRSMRVEHIEGVF